MATEKFRRTKSHVNIGTIGHFDHGKTTLTAAILKVQSQQNLAKAKSYAEIAKGGIVRSPEKIVTAASVEVEYESAKRHYAHIDCPGLPDYTKNMFDGAAQMDGAILVVSAVDSLQAQTREHVLLARQAGVNYFVVFLNKCDQVNDSARLDQIEIEIRELLNKYKFDGDNAPIIRGAALPALQGDPQWEESIQKLLQAIDAYIPTPWREIDKPFLMGVANVFRVRGRGTVVKGKIAKGTVKVGDEVEVIGIKEKQRTVVTGVQMFGKLLDQGQAGDLVTCLLRGLEPEDISRDQVLIKPGSITPHTEFEAAIYVLTKEEGGRHTPFFTNYRPQFYIGTADVTGVVKLPDHTNMVMPGDEITLTIELVAPVYLEEEMRFAVREGDKTVGDGVIAKILQ